MLVIPQTAQTISLEVSAECKSVDFDIEVCANELQNCFDPSAGVLHQILCNGPGLLGSQFGRAMASNGRAHAPPQVVWSAA